jgi:glycoprotein-N-acetylgalactosamine 3-beta-galactosyltransferase
VDIYRAHPNYDWYLKADDDTFIFMDNLRDFLSDKKPRAPVSYGFHILHGNPTGYLSGGAGYVLSNEALTRLGAKLTTSYANCINRGIEDADIAIALRSLGVYPDKSVDDEGRERFHPLEIDKHLNGPIYEWIYRHAANFVQQV